ncbi:MAG: zinc ribbon domain-containing protein [Acidiferrobacterales bacterium]
MSTLAKDCPQCGDTNAAYAVRCRCGYEFNSLECDEVADDDFATTIQEEELYVEYLAARAQQAAAEAQAAAKAAAADPGNRQLAKSAELAKSAAEQAHAELHSQRTRVVASGHAPRPENAQSPAVEEVKPAHAASEAVVMSAKASTDAQKPDNDDAARAPASPSPPPVSTSTAGPAASRPTARSQQDAAPETPQARASRVTPVAEERKVPSNTSGTSPSIAGAANKVDTPRSATASPPEAGRAGNEKTAASAQEQLGAAAARAAAAERAKRLEAILRTAQAARASKSDANNTVTNNIQSTPPRDQSGQVSKETDSAHAAAPAEPTKHAADKEINGTPRRAAELDRIEVPGELAPGSTATTSAPVDAQPASADEPAQTVRSDREPEPATPVNGTPLPTAAATGTSAASVETTTVTVTSSVDPQAELEAALRALTAGSALADTTESLSAADPSSDAVRDPLQTQTPTTPPAAAAQLPPVDTTPAPAKPANKKDCPNCTAILPMETKRCRCGYEFPTADESMPSLSLSDSDVVAIEDEASASTRITPLG